MQKIDQSKTQQTHVSSDTMRSKTFSGSVKGHAKPNAGEKVAGPPPPPQPQKK